MSKLEDWFPDEEYTKDELYRSASQDDMRTICPILIRLYFQLKVLFTLQYHRRVFVNFPDMKLDSFTYGSISWTKR